MVLWVALLSILVSDVQASATSTRDAGFVRVQGTKFMRQGQPYHFLGTNFWYGMNLGATASGRLRLVRELDRLAAMGVKNLRIVAGTEGPDTEPLRMVPASQKTPGQYDQSLLVGLDFLLAEMKKRDMLAVVCLNNFWPWSGGMAQYLQWSRGGSIPYPPPFEGGTWEQYQAYTGQFYSDPLAVKWAQDWVTSIVTRVNAISGIPYQQDRTIMAWELANEPRGVGNRDAFLKWIDESSAQIKRLDPNHLVTIGSEGDTPWPDYTQTEYVTNHAFRNIDYGTIHIWVQNWGWFDPAAPDTGEQNLEVQYQAALAKVRTYIDTHVQKAKQLQKPLVLEEFGIARDQGSFDPAVSNLLRDRYYRDVFEMVHAELKVGSPLVGVNFWAWAGEGRPAEERGGNLWHAGDAWIGDPPHELQGWYSVYDKDQSTRQLIQEYTRLFSRQ